MSAARSFTVSGPGVDAQIEQTLGVYSFAAITVGEREQVDGFQPGRLGRLGPGPVHLEDHPSRDPAEAAQGALKNLVAQAREIQMSLLPKVSPSFGGYDIWGLSVPAEEVGGDLYDYLPVSERILGIAIADSAGHGLPAALQARDAIIGLRMGIEERLRITATIEKLNRVVNRSALASRFISLFYCEIEPNGNLIYCNAGHPPPLLLRQRRRCSNCAGRPGSRAEPRRAIPRGLYKPMKPGAVLLIVHRRHQRGRERRERCSAWKGSRRCCDRGPGPRPGNWSRRSSPGPRAFSTDGTAAGRSDRGRRDQRPKVSGVAPGRRRPGPRSAGRWPVSM